MCCHLLVIKRKHDWLFLTCRYIRCEFRIPLLGDKEAAPFREMVTQGASSSQASDDNLYITTLTTVSCLSYSTGELYTCQTISFVPEFSTQMHLHVVYKFTMILTVFSGSNNRQLSLQIYLRIYH